MFSGGSCLWVVDGTDLAIQGIGAGFFPLSPVIIVSSTLACISGVITGVVEVFYPPTTCDTGSLTLTYTFG
jgi:hypothetical protein